MGAQLSGRVCVLYLWSYWAWSLPILSLTLPPGSLSKMKMWLGYTWRDQIYEYRYFCFWLLFWHRVSPRSLGWLGPHHITQDSHELLPLLWPHSPKWWGDRCIPPCLATTRALLTVHQSHFSLFCYRISKMTWWTPKSCVKRVWEYSSINDVCLLLHFNDPDVYIDSVNGFQISPLASLQLSLSSSPFSHPPLNWANSSEVCSCIFLHSTALLRPPENSSLL